MESKYILRKQGKNNPVIVLAVYDSRFPSRKFFFYTGQHMDPNQWKKKKGKTGKNKFVYGWPNETQSNQEIIAHLDKLSQAVKGWGKLKIGADDLDRGELKRYLEKVSKAEHEEQRKEAETKLQNESDFFMIWQKIIDTTKGNHGEKISYNTRLSKNQTLNLVTKYCLAKNVKLSFDTIDMEFYHAFDLYMDSQGLSPNSKGKHVKEIKSILREAHDRDITVNNSYQKKSFKVIRKDTDTTYLTEDELKRMLAIAYKPALTKWRDVFVMACYTGLRHSDWHQINARNIVTQNKKEYLKIKQKKTTGSLHIPVHPVVRIILNKYNGDPGKIISNQKLNKSLKDICKHEDLKLEPVIIDGKSVSKKEHISTHTARRSFATNAYLSKSMSVYSIMSCTGHKTEVSFLKYLKLSGMDKAQDIADSKFFSDAEWTSLKVA